MSNAEEDYEDYELETGFEDDDYDEVIGACDECEGNLTEEDCYYDGGFQW